MAYAHHEPARDAVIEVQFGIGIVNTEEIVETLADVAKPVRNAEVQYALAQAFHRAAIYEPRRFEGGECIVFLFGGSVFEFRHQVVLGKCNSA